MIKIKDLVIKFGFVRKLLYFIFMVPSIFYTSLSIITLLESNVGKSFTIISMYQNPIRVDKLYFLGFIAVMSVISSYIINSLSNKNAQLINLSKTDKNMALFSCISVLFVQYYLLFVFTHSIFIIRQLEVIKMITLFSSVIYVFTNNRTKEMLEKWR
jgi:hypothetical protein